MMNNGGSSKCCTLHTTVLHTKSTGKYFKTLLVWKYCHLKFDFGMGTCCFDTISLWVQIAFIEMVQFIKLSHYIIVHL